MRGAAAGGWRVWVDRGGTFTDLVARAPDGALHVLKLLSEDPGRRADAAVEGVRRLLALHGGRVDEVRMGTTVATNALLERRGEPVLLAITRGHADALLIGWQSRPRLFDLHVAKPEPLAARTIEIVERVSVEGEVLVPLDEAQARADLAAARAAGLRAVAVVLMHGHRHTAHEARVAAIAREVGFTQVSVGHEVSPLVKLVGRGDTTVADAYLSPVLARHVDRVRAELAVTPGAEGARLLFMQSSGGLAEAGAFRGKDAVLSGPAGGLVAMAATARAAGFDRVVGFDMGGTSTDVSHHAGAFERAYESTVAGVRLRAPVLAIHTVAAGGGSVCRWEGGRLRVGPRSAGAVPGPAAYRRGGPLTVTDCHFLLGRLRPDRFPAVFGPAGDRPPDVEAVRSGFDALAAQVEADTGRPAAPEDLAEGFLTIAVEDMARAIKRVSTDRGHDLAGYALASFGGAGGQHACRVAAVLGIPRVLLHPLAGVLSAYGMGLARLEAHRQRSVDTAVEAVGWGAVEAAVADLAREACDALLAQGAAPAEVDVEARLLVRYAGTDAALEAPHGPPAAVRAAFEAAHRARFGFHDPGRALVVEAAAVEACAGGAQAPPAAPPVDARPAPAPAAVVSARFDGAWRDVPLHLRAALAPGVELDGPALIQEDTGAVVVEPGWRARVDGGGSLVLEHLARAPPPADAGGGPVDPVRLEVFAARFMAVAEEMGTALQHTASSVNIKERLDFSCALFDPAGRLVANAPHIPVHLGSMGDSVRAVMAARASDGRGLVSGDVYVMNDPFDGGAHLPDVTAIAPVFAHGGAAADGALLGVVAARGHQADVGGLTPGSMPPLSRTVADEGVLIRNHLLVEGDGAGGGRFLEAPLRAVLASGPHPARNPDANLADLRAQVAACAKGAAGLRALAAEAGRAPVHRYMAALQDAASASVERLVGRLGDGAFRYAMDDGAVVAVSLTVDRAARRLLVDFAGTSAQQPTNFNAPLSITRAATLYVLRTLVDEDIPLNEGCLRPVELRVPQGCMLNPRPPAAVVAGNVETSQAVVDALYGAINAGLAAAGGGAVAASQGTMNNLTFGDAAGRRQYYETICGGAGAGPGFSGADAVQTHMTNSRLTDPEVMEARFPVLVDRFAVRRGSGGAGRWRGGDGAVRRLVFREAMTVALLSNRRVVAPFGAAGGGAGALGTARVERADGSVEALPGVAVRELEAGDALVVETPGGGGWGAADPPARG